MPTVSSPAALPSHIEDLLSQRESHVAAVALIDATLARVSSALGVAAAAPAAVAAPRRGRPPKAAPKPKSIPAAAKAPKAAPAAKPKRRGKASPFAMTANEFVLAYVASAKNPTTKDINNHWKASGRPGSADNAMSILSRNKQLKRIPLPGGRGSKFSLP